MERVLTMILAGGAPDALGVLGQYRAKTAMPFGGRYRLIDFPLSNCVNSGLGNIYILTQYNPRSLRRHIRLGRPWDLDRSRGGVRVLLPYTGAERSSWFRGTADALIQNLDIINRSRSRYVLILSGDHIYKMDYRELFHRHVVTAATIATRPARAGDGQRFGMVETDPAGFVRVFREKPGQDLGSDASLGIYLFERDYLIDGLRRLAEMEGTDLVRDLLIPAVEVERFATYRYDGYWEDVGDLNAYYRANLLLVDERPPLVLDDEGWPIYTRSESSSPAWFAPGASVHRSLVGAGCHIEGEVTGSVLFPNVRVEAGARVEHAILFSGCHVESGAQVHRAIMDKEARVGAGALYSGAEGLAVLGKRMLIPAGSRHLDRHDPRDVGMELRP